MSRSEFLVEPDRWSLPQRRTFALRGPLKAPSHRRSTPFWPVGLGIAGLSLALAFTLAPRPAPTLAEPTPPVVAERLPTPRVVGAAEVPVPVAAPAVLEAPAAESRTLSEPAAPRPPAARPAVQALDVGQLPTLQLDAGAFEAASVTEAGPRPQSKPPGRPAAARLAGQP